MVRYMVSLNWTNFIRSTILTAFEAYGSALVGITPMAFPADRQHESDQVTAQRMPAQ
ncbi:MAG TPA: hypothetical protein VGI45_18315 [Terracidiphilus sp.]|jgi:hypothetical protein